MPPMIDSGSQPDYLQPYLDAVECSGAGFDATLWSSRQGQVRRFEVLLELADVAESGCGSILDLGCGVGDLARHLCERSIPFTTYLGIDAIEDMVEAARSVEDPRCRFLVADPVRQPDCLDEAGADWIFISGTLNAMVEETARELVDRAFRAARIGIAFNFLSNRPHPEWNDRDLSPARRFATADWVEWALSRTPLVRFTQAYYRGHDATISMCRAPE